MVSWKRILPLTLVLFAALHAEVRLSPLLTDHMVLQRGRPVHIWGDAAPGETVSVSFRGESRAATADTLGHWSLYLSPGEAGGPFELAVKAGNSILLPDVLVGDVWVGSGQSNMEMATQEVGNAAAEIAAAKYPKIRLFHVLNRVSDFPLRDVKGTGWVACTPETVAKFSAVAYFFGKHLNEKLDVPIGLIESAWGGTPVDSWTSLRAIGADAAFMPVFAEWWKLIEDREVFLEKRRVEMKEWEEAVAKAKAEGRTPPGYPWRGNVEGEWLPGGLYNAMIAPLTAFPIRGAIWYQGESNASQERVPIYAALFQSMIKDWRRAWGQGDFPFLFVQLASFRPSYTATWPELREAQRQTLALASTGMAVAIDIGDPVNIHPTNKQAVGLRLALAARALAYADNVEYSGPLFRQAVPMQGALRVWFDHAGGLRARGASLNGFEIAGADRKYVPAQARIDGTSVVLSNPAVPAPLYVRYGWADDPGCNLYNGAELPASPFRSE